jgi:nucleoid DNA-binding protein
MDKKILNRTDLAKYIAKKTNLQYKDVVSVIEEFKNFVMESCKKGQDIEIKSFINFKNKVLKGGLRMDFQTKQKINVKNMNIVKVSLSGNDIKKINR